MIICHEFTIWLTEHQEGVEDRLFEAGCDDATYAIREGKPLLIFAREGENLNEVVASAVRDVRKAGVGILAVDLD